MDTAETIFFKQAIASDGYEIVNAQKSELNKYMGQYKKFYASAGHYFSGFPVKAITPKGHSRYIRTDILEKHPLLFTEFADLETKSEILHDILKTGKELTTKDEAIICFANKYGLLLPGETITLSFGDMFIDESYIAGEIIPFWNMQIRLMYNLLQVWQRCKDGDIETLNNTIINFGNSLVFNFEYKGSVQRFSIPDKNKKLDVIMQTKLFIQEKANEQTCNFPVKPYLIIDERNNFKQYFCPASLISLLWLQFSRYITGEHQVKQCPVCNKWYDISDESGSTRWNERCPTCANRLRVQKASVKKRYLAGMSIDEIIKKTRNTTPETIKGWIGELEVENNSK